jgi:hypothetical protein
MATKITINNNGSIKVEGDFTIEDRSGNTYDLAMVHIMATSHMRLLLLHFLLKKQFNTEY